MSPAWAAAPIVMGSPTQMVWSPPVLTAGSWFTSTWTDSDLAHPEARFVTTEQGTGIVHCAPSHGPDDFNLCLNNGIKAIETVDGDGKYTNNVKLFEGIHIFKANPIVIEKLREQKNLLFNGELVHSYPHSWRSKAPLVHRATPQWFISMESHKLRDKALKAIDETTFYPNKGKERLKSMIETRLYFLKRSYFSLIIVPIA